MTENKQPYFNGNACLRGASTNGLFTSDFLEDLKAVFDKYGVKNIQAGEDAEPYAFQMGYVKESFGINGAIIRLK